MRTVTFFLNLLSLNLTKAFPMQGFPTCSKVKPVSKRKSRIGNENYRPVSILPIIYKIFEKLIFKPSMFFELVQISVWILEWS